MGHSGLDAVDGTDDQLLNIGSPEDWVKEIRGWTEERFFQLSDHLPAEVTEALLDYAVSGRLPEPQPVELTATPFEHPDSADDWLLCEAREKLTTAIIDTGHGVFSCTKPDDRAALYGCIRGVVLASHGLSSCRRCWAGEDDVQERGPFRLVRDAGHWGSSDPHTLVLGISKGNTQSRALGRDPFEDVAFKGIRHRILEVFQSVGILPNETRDQFEQRFRATERDFAFASVVRCSLTGKDRKKGCHTADSPNVIPAFKQSSDGSGFVENCVDEHLVMLPPRTRLVLLLGNTDAYVSALADVLSRMRGSTSVINPVAYDSANVRFVHLGHPSKGNGHFGAFNRGEGKAGQKRDWARDALVSFGDLHRAVIA